MATATFLEDSRIAVWIALVHYLTYPSTAAHWNQATPVFVVENPNQSRFVAEFLPAYFDSAESSSEELD